MAKRDLSKRAWEIDLARGMAVTLMAAFHAVFDLTEFFGQGLDYQSGFWSYVGRLSAIMFMFVSGISSRFSKSLIKRGFIVFCFGLVISIASVPLMGEHYVRFGILHFFGAVMVLSGLLEKAVKSEKIRNMVYAASIPVSIILGNAFAKITSNTPILLPLGIMYRGFTSFDYYPVFPWLAFYSAGILTGALLYRERKSLIIADPFRAGENAAKTAPLLILRGLCFLGRHSLIVYMLHQPIIFAVFYILFNIPRMLS